MNLYIAEVINVADKDANGTDQKIGRVQIYCAPIHHNIKKNSSDLLPWAQSASCFTSFIPAVGDFVWIFFEKEEFYQNPFYMAPVNFSALHNHNKIIGSITSEYPDVKYIWLPNDVAIGMSAKDDNAEISIHHPKAEIYIEKDGHAKLYFSEDKNKLDITSDGIVITDINNNIITCNGDGLKTEDKNGNKVTCDSSGTIVEDKNGNQIKMESTGITITGGLKLVVNGTPVPATSGPFNCLTNCLFTGSPHAASEVQGI